MVAKGVSRIVVNTDIVPTAQFQANNAIQFDAETQVNLLRDLVAHPLAVVQERELEITGTFRYANTWPTAIALVASGRVNLDRLVTGHYRLEQAEEALTAGHRDENAVKVILRPQT